MNAMNASPDVRSQLQELFATQRLAVLATDHNGQPYASLVAFAINADLRELLFATTRDTRKFANLQANPRVSLLIDNRANQVTDFSAAVAVTVLGSSAELTGPARRAGTAPPAVLEGQPPRPSCSRPECGPRSLEGSCR